MLWPAANFLTPQSVTVAQPCVSPGAPSCRRPPALAPVGFWTRCCPLAFASSDYASAWSSASARRPGRWLSCCLGPVSENSTTSASINAAFRRLCEPEPRCLSAARALQHGLVAVCCMQPMGEQCQAGLGRRSRTLILTYPASPSDCPVLYCTVLCIL